MSEEIIAYISRRLKMLSITITLVGSIGVAFFSSPSVSTQEFFGTPIGVFECAFLTIFFFVLLVVLEIDQESQEEKDRRKEFYRLSDQIKVYHTDLQSCPEGAEGYEELRDRLLEFKAMLFGRFAIDTPPIPTHFDNSEWKECKEQWRKFLGALYLACKARDFKAARQASNVSTDFFPKARN